MHSVIERLKKRKIVRWALAYLAGAWLMLQLADTLGPRWGMSAAEARILDGALLVGFAITLVLAWYHGEKGHQRVTRSELVVLAGVGIVTTGLFVVLWPRLEPRSPTPSTVDTVPEKSVVVLPFADYSPDGDQGYFALGIAEELLNSLSQVPDLKVISRTSAFAFRDRAEITLPEIASRLRVAHVLEGSVRKSGDDVRVTVQLIDTRTDTNLLSANYDGTMGNVFGLQDSIAAEVVSSLRAEILGTPPSLEQIDPEAYQLFLLGRHVLNQRDRDWFERSRDLLERVLDAEPNYEPAILWLALAYSDAALRLPSTEADVLRTRASELVDRALAVNPTSARAHGIRSGLLHPADLDGMAREMQAALDLSPRDPEIVMWAGITLQLLDRHEEAVPFLKYKVDRDPLDIISLTNLALAYHYAGDYESNIEVRERLDALNPGFGAPGIALSLLLLERPTAAAEWVDRTNSALLRDVLSALVAHSNGRADEYRSEAEAFEHRWGDEQPAFTALVHAWGGQADAAFRWLDTLTPWTASLGGTLPLTSRPEFASLHGDPRWAAFLRRVGQSRNALHAVRFDPVLPADDEG